MIEIAIDKDLQEIFGMISWPTLFCHLYDEMKVIQFNALNKKIDDADFVIRVVSTRPVPFKSL